MLIMIVLLNENYHIKVNINTKNDLVLNQVTFSIILPGDFFWRNFRCSLLVACDLCHQSDLLMVNGLLCVPWFPEPRES